MFSNQEPDDFHRASRRSVTWAPLLGAAVFGTAAASAREPRSFAEVIAESGLEDWSVGKLRGLMNMGCEDGIFG